MSLRYRDPKKVFPNGPPQRKNFDKACDFSTSFSIYAYEDLPLQVLQEMVEKFELKDMALSFHHCLIS